MKTHFDMLTGKSFSDGIYIKNSSLIQIPQLPSSSDLKTVSEKVNEFRKGLKRRYIAFICVVSFILVISFFYLLCFNYVYPYTQIEWIKSSITIFIIMQLLSLLKCILETSLRFLSYKFNSEKLYKISKFLN